MPFYNHQCPTCTVDDFIKSPADGLRVYIDSAAKEFRKEPFVWEEMYSISTKPDIPCPVCGKISTRTMAGINTNFIIPGSFTADKVECKTLANIHKLENDDPYGHMRESGEKDEKIGQFKKVLKRKAIGKSDKYAYGVKQKRAKRKKKIDLGKQNTQLQ